MYSDLHDHRCVAGVNLDTKKWVRLIGRQIPGCLTRKESSYSGGKEVALLDVFEAELDKPCGSNCHPEDVYIAERPWRFVRSFDSLAESQFLATCISGKSNVLEGCGDRIETTRFEAEPALCSLELNHPEDLWWWIREENGKRKNRALFRLGHLGRIRY